MPTISIERICPQAGVPGGRVRVECRGLDPQALDACALVFGTTPTRPVLATPTLVVGVVPAESEATTVCLVQDGRRSSAVPFVVATPLADNLHPVANPAVDAQGVIYTTVSGTGGQEVPVSVYRISPYGEVEPFASGIINATGLALGPDGDLYVSSRHDGTVYRIDATGTVTPFAEQLGLATGLAFDALGRLYVGDRRGVIYQVLEPGTARVFARLEPSVAAYHLAFGDDDLLYVSYSTLCGDDRIYRITPDGEVEVYASGLGRAQGLAFDADHNLYVVAHYEGQGGIVCITPDGRIEPVVSGVNLVGLAFGADGDLIVVDHSTVYRLALGVRGRPLP
ncbi:MAG: hypothetical protein KatS3mg131_1858 [Candidatus Tectimicrobiota bacterium]|nr:MAG: hypothetical protein KatS3mg131_1858 [Candidatus Tectomicrobia bacterium]